MKKTALIVVIIIFVLNLPPIKWFFGKEDLLYSNANGSFTFDELNISGRNYKLCKDNFEAFKLLHKKDTILYRITPLNFLKLWRWSDYLTKEKYKLPYKDWESIEAVRGRIQNKSAWQAF